MNSQEIREVEKEIRHLIAFELKRLTPEQRKDLLTKVNSYNVHLILSRRDLSEIYENLYQTPLRYGIYFIFDFTVKLNYLLKRISETLPSFIRQTIAHSYYELWSETVSQQENTISGFAHQQQTSYSFEEVKKLMADEKWIFGLMVFILYNEEFPS